MQLDEDTYQKLPDRLKALFEKLPNPGQHEVVDLFPQTGPGGYPAKRKGVGYHDGASGQSGLTAAKTDAGSVARYFYAAKASKSERNLGVDGKNTHPTVKPLALTEYLARLLLPPERDTPRRILVPFAGSGSEIIGALRAGWDKAVGIEREPEYVAIAEQRI
ncbi:MAG TPA: DNA methyltransferase, partial [Ferrovibrio sp.]|uniref:DNA methyltransferase n=1 Tax=Ferrovibrio sp. TaxID=1917215 RepID=UPI002ED3FD68